MAKTQEIPSIHTSNLEILIRTIVRDYGKKDPEVLVKALTRNLSSLGRSGKIGFRYPDEPEFFSQYATLDTPYEKGRQLFILEG